MNRIVAAAFAGTVATLPMTAVMLALHRRLPAKEQYPLPPREITELTLRRAGLRRRPPHITHLSLLAHFGYGALTGAFYPLVVPRARHPILAGGGYGLAIWAASYLGWIPAAQILQPATQHPARRNRLMIAAHLVWGAGTALVDRWLSESEASPPALTARAGRGLLVPRGFHHRYLSAFES